MRWSDEGEFAELRRVTSPRLRRMGISQGDAIEPRLDGLELLSWDPGPQPPRRGVS